MIPFYHSKPNNAVVINPAAFYPGKPPDGGMPLVYKGATLHAFPLTLENAHTLRSLGARVPSPIRHGYDWPRVASVHPPRAHQVDTAEFFTLHQRGYCLNEIGTGKTYSALWAADYLMREGYVRKCLILSPLSTLNPVWGDSIFATFPHRKYAILHGDAAKRRKLFKDDKFDFFVVNHDGLKILADMKFGKRGLESVTLMRDDIDLVIIDEMSVYRYSNTERWAYLNKAIQSLDNPWVWALTGTPTPNAPTDAFGQARIVTPDRVPRHFSVFRMQTMRQITQFKWEERPEANDIVSQVLQPSIRVTRDEAYDLPDTIYSTREAEMTAEQKKHYDELMSKLVTEFKSGARITAVNEGVKMTKLLQIAAGVVYDKEGAEVVLDAKHRKAVLKEIIEQAGQKVIVFVPYTSVLQDVLKSVQSWGYTAEMIYGGVAPSVRTRIFRDFQKTPNPRVLVADAGTMSHGLTLTEASTIVWYGPEASNDTYTQANGRITREGQRNVTNIVHITSSPLETKRFKILEKRGSMQGALLEILEEMSRGKG